MYSFIVHCGPPPCQCGLRDLDKIRKACLPENIGTDGGYRSENMSAQKLKDWQADENRDKNLLTIRSKTTRSSLLKT